MTIYVFDANAVVSAALSPHGTSRRAIEAARASGTIALSDAVFQEISDVLRRPKFARYFADRRNDEILELLVADSIWTTPTEKIIDCRDPKDNCYLELALAAGAIIIVSGDDDLLILDPWRGVRIMRPTEFLRVEAP